MADLAMTIIQAGAMFSIFAYVFSRGLMTSPGDLTYFRAHRGLLFRSLLAVDVLVPLIALIVVLLVAPAKAIAVGILIMASSPAAPMVLKKIAKAGGKSEYAVTLYIVLALLAIITTPITLALLSRAAGFQLDVSPTAVAGRVGVSIFLPIIAGMIIKWRFPALADRIFRPLETLSNVIFILVVITVLLFTYQVLFVPDIREYIALGLMIAGALVAGHLMARGQPEEQTTLALESATRNIGLALLITSAYAPLEKALPVLIPYLVTSTIIGLIYIRYQKRELVLASPPGP